MTTDQKNPIVTLRNVAMLLPFVGTEETCYYLNGIRMEPQPDGGCILIATEGHAILVINDAAAYAPEPLVWKPSRTLVAAAQTYQPVVTFDEDGFNDSTLVPSDDETIELTSPTMGERLETCGDVFKNGTDWVDWRKVLSDAEEPASAIFNPAVMARFATVGLFEAQTLYASKGHDRGDGYSPWLIRVNANCFGSIMPTRMNKITTFTIPDWVKGKPQT